MNTVSVFSFEEDVPRADALAQALCRQTGEKVARSTVHCRLFPDGESLVSVPVDGFKGTAILYRSLGDPNGKLFDLILAASALRDQGIKRIVLVAPYLPYMRQDCAFHAGEAISQKVLGGYFAGHFEGILSVDPHLHRTSSLAEVFPGRATLALSGAPALAELLRKRNIGPEAVLIGPDSESIHQVGVLSEALGLPFIVGQKERRSDRKVILTLPTSPILKGKTAIIVDDVVSSGTTLVACAEAARLQGAVLVEAAIVHALFDEKSAAAFHAAGIDPVVSCDGLPHPSNGASLAPMLAQGLETLLQGMS